MLHQAVVWTHTICSLPCIVSTKRCIVDTGHLVCSKHPSTVSASQMHRQHVPTHDEPRTKAPDAHPSTHCSTPCHVLFPKACAATALFLQAQQQAHAPFARLAWPAVPACLCTSRWLVRRCTAWFMPCRTYPLSRHRQSHQSHNYH